MDWDIWGHDWAAKLLHDHIVEENVHHAYLFTGPRGIGRRTLALRFAQALNCEHPPSVGIPCFQCRTCQQFDGMGHPDLMVIQAEKEGEVLKVELIREMQHVLALHPYDARYRIALLLRFEEANPFAMNALLKTLEEPAPRVVILLTAENTERLLPTIVSRCEVIRLRPVPLEKMIWGLSTKLGLSDDESHLLAHISSGRPGHAVRLHQHPDILEQRCTWLDELVRLMGANRVDRFAFAASFLDVRKRLINYRFRELLIVWLSFWRDVLLKAAGAETPITNIDHQQKIEWIAKMIGMTEAHRVIVCLENSMDMIEKNINGRLVAEVAMLDLPYINNRDI